MIKQLKKSKFKKTVAIYLAMMILLEAIQPMKMYALTSGPTQPEFNAFTPIGTSDMVNLSTGDFNYNIPIMDVGGYPLNLAYNSGVTMDQEASWVGLGWNLNVGEISRQVRGLPDDFRGDKMRYENNLRDNVTVGTNLNVSPAFFGSDFPIKGGFGLGVQYNNYEGITFKPSIGVSYSISDQVNVGFNLSGSTAEGATLSPSVSISQKIGETDRFQSSLGASAGIVLNNRKGVENLNISVFANTSKKVLNSIKDGGGSKWKSIGGDGIGGSISLNNTNNYTPTKRVAYDNLNNTFNATFGTEIYGVEAQFRITGYGSVQKINAKYKDRLVGGYGYENTQYKNNLEGVLDFNREKEQTISKNTNVLPVTNYTYDTYNIEGQGVSGMFRPFRSKVGYLYNDDVSDFSSSNSFGVEIGGGSIFHGGVNFLNSPTTSTTSKWSKKNNALPYFAESNTDKNNPLYEQSTFKLIGELNVDNESNKTFNNSALKLDISGGKFNRSLASTYLAKPETTINPIVLNIDKVKRTERLGRNQTVQKITNAEAKADEKFIFSNANAKPHHTVGMKVLQTDGTTYVYGQSVYNTTKVEATFDVSAKGGDSRTGIVGYNGTVSSDNRSVLNDNGTADSDHYVNKITTPGYAHSYLITSVLSSDYQDIDNNGPSDKDLGTYTKFDYTKTVGNYKWRVPYGTNEASYNEGLRTSKKDQKGNYIYGEKELVYLKKIETKTHVAFIDLESRKDAMGVDKEQGGRGAQAMSCIKSIRLYSKSEILVNGIVVDPGITSNIKPIKTAHFEYDYSLCGSIPPNNGVQEMINGVNINSKKGKLTLKRVYFTYRASNMGKYTPYKFDYAAFNPNYNIKGFDIWGNYKENAISNPLTTSEFPFVEQEKTKADANSISQEQTNANQNTSAWVLKKITLPSGGELNIQTESDDYKYVQNKKAMQMFKVVGAGDTVTPIASTTNTAQLFSGKTPNKYIYVKVSDATLSNKEFINKYLSENIDKPIYFKFLMNMTSSSQDFVSGYFEIDKDITKRSEMEVSNGMVAIPLKFLKIDGMVNGGRLINPIAKAGWGFGRTYLNRAVYSLGGEETNKSFSSIVLDLKNSIKSMTEVFKSPNGLLETKGCAKYFDTERSWIRLENPNGKKLGGGLRVNKIELSDSWDVMNSVEDNTIYKEKYGQNYSYTLEDGISSSGVATFEPNASPENPFVEPFYGKDASSYADKIAAPKEMNYVEKPFGESFFPSPKITYSRVTVTNLDKHGENGNNIVKKHATGKVVTEHYTTHDFPTLVDYTNLDIRLDEMKSPLLKLLNIVSIDHLTASQGFSIETNDMDGKVKSEKVYGEGQTTPISRVDYKYNVDSDGKLNNNLTTINSKGTVQTNLLGVNYDLINDFNESSSITKSRGFDANVAFFVVGFWPVFVPRVFPKISNNESILRTSTTTKVTHKTGILIEKVAYDLGSKVSTKNLAWDANTGQVLLTQTINEFDDSYYSFNYPAYWMYDGMGLASQNIGIEGTLIANAPITGPNTSSGASNNPYFKLENYSGEVSKIFHVGDELQVLDQGGIVQSSETLDVNLSAQYKLWVVGFNADKSGVLLMDRNGVYINKCEDLNSIRFKITRSGYRNMQSATMASVTSMINPIKNGKLDQDSFLFNASSSFNPRIINASAVVYKDYWNTQLESNLPYYPDYNSNWIMPSGDVKYPNDVKVNPYLWNIKGNWRAEKSYAYLTGRNSSVGQGQKNRRNEGFFTSFNPFYILDTNPSIPVWTVDDTNWTYASSVTKYSPYGAELENKDALERYSAAQYGYAYKLPMAVASNSKYQQIGYEGFEEKKTETLKKHFEFANDKDNIDSNQSHTGKNSLKVAKGSSSSMYRNLYPAIETIGEAKCANINPGNTKLNWKHWLYAGTANDGSLHDYTIDGDFVLKVNNSTVIDDIGYPHIGYQKDGTVSVQVGDVIELTQRTSNDKEYAGFATLLVSVLNLYKSENADPNGYAEVTLTFTVPENTPEINIEGRN